MDKHPIIIVGSGLAAYMLAKEFRKLDTHSTLLIITAGEGSFYSKPLLSTALMQKKEPEVLAVSTAAAMSQELKAVVMTHTRVERIDPVQQVVQLHNHESLYYSKLILACGAEVVQAPLQGDAVAKLYSVNNLEDYAIFRRALVNKQEIAILGSGLVGCEFANDLVNSGYKVQLIAPDLSPLQRLVPSVIGDCLAKAFVEAGVQLELGVGAEAVNQISNRFALNLSDGRTIEADVILSAVGLRPNLSLAKSAKLLTHRGIVVDQQLRTSDPNIYALGDCAEVMGQVNLYVAPLLQCARVLAQVLAGHEAAVRYPPMPIVVKTSLCPIAVQLPPEDAAIHWKFSGDAPNCRALAYQEDRLLGFALAGNCVKERIELLKALAVTGD